VINF